MTGAAPDAAPPRGDETQRAALGGGDDALRAALGDGDDALRAVLRDGDDAGAARLYARAARSAPSEDARAFLLTHAMVHALAAGDPLAARAEAQLRAMGRA
ncbi:MAG: hypothetical protein ACU0BS_02095 [Hasllibacter sp.]